MPGRSHWSLVTSRLCGWRKILAISHSPLDNLLVSGGCCILVNSNLTVGTILDRNHYIKIKKTWDLLHQLWKEKGQNKFCPLIFWIDVESSIPWLEVLWFIPQSLHKSSRGIITTSLANFQMITSFQIVMSYLMNNEIYNIFWKIRYWYRSQ